MRGVRRFTDLRAWQACDVYKKAVHKEDSVAGPPGHVAEGFGRFNPPDFARFTVIARSSIMESQSHLIDAVDKRYITEQTRLELDSLAASALEEVTGLMEYLQSPEALRNARRARERRIASRPERLSRRTQNREPSNPEQANPEQANPEHPNKEPRTEREHEPRSENPEE
jgi:four helix bundle protein